MNKEPTCRCPYCRFLHYLGTLLTGDILLCTCGARLRVQHNGDGTTSLWPQEPRR